MILGEWQLSTSFWVKVFITVLNLAMAGLLQPPLPVTMFSYVISVYYQYPTCLRFTSTFSDLTETTRSHSCENDIQPPIHVPQLVEQLSLSETTVCVAHAALEKLLG